MRDRTAVVEDRPRVSATINITPLVDVCLVLLIIFMVVTPMLHGSAEIALPETPRPPVLAEAENQLTITLERDHGGVKIDRVWTSWQDLPLRLRQAQAAGPDRKVVIKADGRVKYRTVLTILRQLSTAGFRGAGLAVRRLPGGGERQQ
jgi:biopolymer transport protein ExbD